jgi:hypothetical protein
MSLPNCSLCEQEPPVLLHNDVLTGDQVWVGASCLPTFILTCAAEITKGMPAEWCQGNGSLFDMIAENDSRPDKPPAAGVKRTRAKKTAADAPEAAATGLTAVVLNPDDACPQCGGRQATGDDAKLTCDGCGNVLAVIPTATG